jgi:hypothetical protein
MRATAVLEAGVGGISWSTVQRTHERNARQNDRDSRLESGKYCSKYTFVRHVREV